MLKMLLPLRFSISGLPVLDKDGRIGGVISKGDIFRSMPLLQALQVKDRSLPSGYSTDQGLYIMYPISPRSCNRCKYSKTKKVYVSRTSNLAFS